MPDNHDNHPFHSDPELPFDKSGASPFSSPEGYFDALGSKVWARIEAEEELKEFSVLSSISKQQSFTVPADYFENSINRQQELSAYPQLSGIPKPVFKVVEEHYFETSAQQVLYKAELADELLTYPALHALDKRLGFTVVPAYFEDLPGRVRDRILASKQQPANLLTRIIGLLFRPRFAMSFSAALLLIFGLFIYNRPATVAPAGNTDCNTLACLEQSDLLNDNTVHTFDEDNLFDMVDVKALDRQISKGISRPDPAVQEQYIIDNVNTDQLMEEL